MLMLVKFPDGKLSNELVYDEKNYKEAEIICPALMDTALNRVELSCWLEFKDGKIQINKEKKDKILNDEREAKEKEDLARSEKENARKDFKLLPPNATLLQVIEAINKINMIYKDPEPVSGKPSNAVKATLYIDGKISKKGN